jgi:hypothetical protein
MPDPRLCARIALAAALAIAAVALPVAAQEENDEENDEAVCYHTEFDEEGNPTGPEFCTLEAWFHRAETHAGNLGATGATGYPSWSAEEPTASVTAGAGGGYLGNGTFWQTGNDDDPTYAPTFEGTFTGNIDNLDVTMYLFAPGRQNEADILMGIKLVIDGQDVGWISETNLPLEPGGDAVLMTGFVLTGIHDAMTLMGLETGDDVEHDLRLQIVPYAIATTTAILVYDTSEVPSGMVFNTAEPSDWPQLAVW